jgi:light-regulated signal transduction histidine kinase (bacteriophytochrome)
MAGGRQIPGSPSRRLMIAHEAANTVTDPFETIRELQRELSETNRGLVALTLELEHRVDARTAELREAHEELQKTNSELLQLTLELEERLARRTEEIRKLNEEAESRVKRRTAELEAANEELEAFTYSVSHDLRAPLRHVDGFSALLLENHPGEVSAEAQEYISTIRESVVEMGVLIDELLNLSRVGRKALKFETTALSSLARAVAADLQRANPSRCIEWKIQALPVVECDGVLIKQVFMNLLSNAVKYTRPRKSAVIEVGTVLEDGSRAVFVRDNGVGFDMKYAQKLFAAFQRLHRKEDFEGTGVGLATVQRIIHKHGGRVWAEAEPDRGATFYFTLGQAHDFATPKAAADSGDRP